MSLEIRNPSQDTGIFIRRSILAAVVVIIMTLILLGRMVFLQVYQYDIFANQSESNRIQLQPIAPTRGLIFDRNGELLAENIPSYSLTIIKERVVDLDQTLGFLGTLVNLRAEDLQKFTKRIRQRRRPFEPVVLKQKLTSEEIARVKVNNFFLPGVEVEARLVRHYPHGDALAHALGYVGRINEREARRLDKTRYAATNSIGKIGIEKFYEDVLHGEVGYQKVETNARGRIINVLEKNPPTPGKNLTLQMDINVQKAAQEAMAGRRGSVVAINPKNGGVIALVSSPTYDPNLFVTGISNKDYGALRDSPDLPLFNRAIRGQYPPGSTIKPFMGLSFIDSETATWDTTVEDPGFFTLENEDRIYRDWKRDGHGDNVNLRQAMIESCDTYFYNISVQTGIDKINPFMDKFAFGRHSARDIGDALKGLLPDREWKNRIKRWAWFAGDTVNLSIGQGYMLVTPLQLAAATATLANKGIWAEPKVVRYLGDLDLNTVPLPDTLAPIELDSDDHWDRMFSAMEGVITATKGTAKNLQRGLQYRIAGKTGTAQVVGIKQGEEYDSSKLTERQRDHALFIAFAPIDDPQIAVAAIVENGEKPNRTAGVIARKVMDTYLLGEQYYDRPLELREAEAKALREKELAELAELEALL